jgi:hypothetical protein
MSILTSNAFRYSIAKSERGTWQAISPEGVVLAEFDDVVAAWNWRPDRNGGLSDNLSHNGISDSFECSDNSRGLDCGNDFRL